MKKGVGGAMSEKTVGKSDKQQDIEDRLAYIIHGIALAINIFRKGVEWVDAVGSSPLEHLHLHMNNGRDVILLNPGVDVFPERCSFYAEAYSKLGAIHSGPIGDPEFLRGAVRIVQKLRNMALRGRLPVMLSLSKHELHPNHRLPPPKSNSTHRFASQR